ncbi:tetratricopeptide repeat protein [Streptomyces sp. IB201691-2A2]|nr:tetratricopeptide repeat protein [Streptomyces sp. IB201691-2A2]
MTGNYQTASQLHIQALARFEEIDNHHGRANALHDLGRTRYAMGEYAKAAELFQQALALFRDVTDPQGEAEVWNSLGILRTTTVSSRAGLEAHHKALELAHQAGSPFDEAQALEGAARSHVLNGDLERAMADLRRAVRIYDHIGAAVAFSKPTDGRSGTSE